MRKIGPNIKRICVALQEQGGGLETSNSSPNCCLTIEKPKSKLKEVVSVSVASSEDTFLAMKPQSCSASAIAMLEASPGKTNYPASSSKAASKVAAEQKELPSAPASKMDGSYKIFCDKGQRIMNKIIQSSGEVISATMQPGPTVFSAPESAAGSEAADGPAAEQASRRGAE